MIKLMEPNLYEEAAELLFHELYDGSYQDLTKSFQRFDNHEAAAPLLDACLEMENACKKLKIEDDILALKLDENTYIGEILWRVYYKFDSEAPLAPLLLERFQKTKGADFLVVCLYHADANVENYEFEEMQQQLLNSDLDAEIKCQLLKICLNPEPIITKLCLLVEKIADLIQPILEKYAPMFTIASTFLSHTTEEVFRQKFPLKVSDTEETCILPLLTGLNKAWFADLGRNTNTILGVGLLFFVLDLFSSSQHLHPEILSQHLKCFSDDTKAKILLELSKGDTYQAALAKQLNLTPATISHHLDYLASYGVISNDVHEKKIYYHLERGWVDFLASELKRLFGSGN